MEMFKAATYDISQIPEKEIWPRLVLLLLTLYLGYQFTEVYEPVGILLLLVAMGVVIYDRTKDYGEREEPGIRVGELTMSGTEIQLNNEIIQVSDIDELKIEIGRVMGEISWWTYGYTISSGTRSLLTITTKGKKYSQNFQIVSERHLMQLEKVLLLFYQNGIFVKEFLRGGRTYLLEELDYEEIQEFKKKYGFSSK